MQRMYCLALIVLGSPVDGPRVVIGNRYVDVSRAE